MLQQAPAILRLVLGVCGSTLEAAFEISKPMPGAVQAEEERLGAKAKKATRILRLQHRFGFGVRVSARQVVAALLGAISAGAQLLNRR